MNDLKVVIDAGHGGTDPGAVSNGVNEKDLNLMIAKYMLEKFLEAGVPATLIRTTDETISPTERVKRILAAYGDSPNVVVISNHINSSDTPNAEGAEVIYALRNTDELAKNILSSLEKAGQKVRTVYQRRLPSNPNKDYYFIHRDTGTTQPVIVEYGYINNPDDLKRIQDNYKKYVNAVVSGVLKTFGINQNMTTTSTPENSHMYTVKAGDTLWSIAKRYNTTVEELMKLNNLNNDLLSIGKVLIIPPTKSISTNTNMYTVKAGDTLWNIAKRYNTTVEKLMMLNNLSNDLIMIGQELILPNTNVHIVKAGDTLWNIAKRHNTTVENLMKINNLSSDLIKIGQVIRL